MKSKHTISFVLTLLALVFLSATAKADNLLPAQPEVSFFYPPYAKKQPTYSEGGVLAVNLKQASGKNMALLKVMLPADKLEDGKQYAFKVSAKASLGCPVILNFPQVSPDGEKKADGTVKPKSNWNNVGKNWKVLSGKFVYDSSVNDGNITFFWTKNAVQKGATLEFQRMELFPMD